MADMHLTYREVGGNAHAAARHYAEKFPNQQKPNYEIFSQTD
jgi:hypothetical protein